MSIIVCGIVHVYLQIACTYMYVPWVISESDLFICIYQWSGSGGFAKCEGTSREEALENTAKRERITSDSDIKAFYRRFVMEDGSSVTLDSSLVYAHVRQCVNDLKRQRNGGTSLAVQAKVHITVSCR